jgi:hypothetical protein
VRVMGVDPELTRCGLSVVESGRGRQIVALDVDVVRTPADDPLPTRLLAISDAVEYWRDVHRPDVIVIKRVFSQQICREGHRPGRRCDRGGGKGHAGKAKSPGWSLKPLRCK